MKSIFDNEYYRSHSPLIRQALTTTLFGFSTMFTGFTQGFSAVLLPQLEKHASFPYDKINGTWIASLPTLFMMLGCLACGSLLDRFGRKRVLLVFFFPQFISYMIMGFANSVWLLDVGRCIAGFSSGALRSITIVYVGEISDPMYRGITLFAPSLGVCAGIIIIHALGIFLCWKTTAFICAGLSAILFLTLFTLTESPLWLISKGRTNEGMILFRWFRGDHEAAENELHRALVKANEEKSDVKLSETIRSMFNVSFLKPLFIVSLVCLNVQFSSVNPICFYSIDIINKTFNGKVNADLIMSISDVVRLLVIIMNGVFGKKISRKKLFFINAFLCVAALYASCVFLSFNPPGFVWVAIILFMMYIIFSSSLVSISWSFICELFPLNLRGLGSSISSCFTFLSLFIALKLTPLVLEKCGIVALNAMFGSVTLATSILLLFLLPDTYGKTLQDIEAIYERKENTNNLTN